MRIITIATVCALTATLPVGAQQVERIKARGANAAGACAGSLDMLGQYMSRAAAPNPEKLREVQQARDFFAEMPRYPNSEIAAAAQAFVQLMSNRIRNAKTATEREAIQREIVTVSSGCYASAKADLKAFQNAAPGTGITPAQPSAPTYEAMPVQPYTTQPLTLDPVPAQ